MRQTIFEQVECQMCKNKFIFSVLLKAEDIVVVLNAMLNFCNHTGLWYQKGWGDLCQFD